MTGFQNRSFEECQVSVEKSAWKLSFFKSLETINIPIKETKSDQAKEISKATILTTRKTTRRRMTDSGVNSGFVSPQTFAFVY